MKDAPTFSALVDREWQAIILKDDRPSPAERPDMALITKGELSDAMLEGFMFARQVWSDKANEGLRGWAYPHASGYEVKR